MEALQLLNLFILPGIFYIVRLEKRIYALELILKYRIENLACAKPNGGLPCHLEGANLT